MPANGAGRDPELGSDLLVPPAFGDEIEDLALAGGQRVGRRLVERQATRSGRGQSEP
jgi:hypothetical protein